MQKKTVRAGIVGAGFSAKFHFESSRKVCQTDIDIRGVYDTDAKMGAAYAADRDIKAYGSLDELLDMSAAFQAVCHGEPDHAEAVNAFFDKRPGNYREK